MRYVTEPLRNPGTLLGTQSATPMLVTLEAAGGYRTVTTRLLKRESLGLQHTVANSGMVCALKWQTGNGPLPDLKEQCGGKEWSSRNKVSLVLSHSGGTLVEKKKKPM